MHDPWKVSQDGEENVDQEIRTTTSLKEDTKRGEDDGNNDLADVAVRYILSFLFL